MRWLKMLLAVVGAVLAATIGLFAVAIFAVGLLAYLVGRLLLRRARRDSLSTPAPRVGRKPAASGDIIEVTATEVPAERLTK